MTRNELKRRTPGLFVVCGLALLAAVAVLSVEMPEKVILEACGDTKAPVTFDHKAHSEKVEGCVTCHHTQKDLTVDADMTVETCVSCHLTPEDSETPVCSEKSLKKNPMHIACVGCHKALKKEDAETAAPTKCKQCHPKA